MPSQRTKSTVPGIFYRERAKVPGSRQLVRVYCIAAKDATGKLRWEQHDEKGNDLLSLDAAKDRKEQLRGKKKAGTLVHSTSKATFSDYAAGWLPLQAADLAPRTYEDYALKLERAKRHIGRVKLSAVNEDVIRALVAELKKVYASNTVANSLVPVSCLLDDAVEAGILGRNPVTALREKGKRKSRKSARAIPVAKNVKEQRILSSPEIDALLSAATSDRYRVLLQTAIYTGLRQMELLGLVWGDVDFDERIIRVRFQLSRTPGEGRVPLKTDNGKRDVYLSDELVSALRAYRASTIYKGDESYIFSTGSGKPLGWSNVDRHCLTPAVTAAKLRTPWPTFHDLRHTYASLLIARGVNVKTVSVALGHADPGFTLRVYTGLFNRDEDAAQIREATRGNPVVTGVSEKRRAGQTGQLVQFPASPHTSEVAAASSRSS